MSLVFTIGYEGTDIDRFVQTLKAVGIMTVADVRAVPLSRKKGFSKKGLAQRLFEEGIEYLHFVNLGDPKDGRDAARAGLYDKFRAIYSAHLRGDEAQSAIKNLADVVDGTPTCLLCFERDPETCHRSIVAHELGVDIFNLYGDDPERYVRNSARIPRHNSHQSTAAA